MKIAIKFFKRQYDKIMSILFLQKVFSKDGDFIKVKRRLKNEMWLLPINGGTMDIRHANIIRRGIKSHLKNKYSSREVSLEFDETLLDCGSFVGGLTTSSSSTARRVVAIEPSPNNYKCLLANINFNCSKEEQSKIKVLNIGLSAKNGMAKLNLSKSGCDDSFLTPDFNSLEDSITVDVLTVDEVIRTERLNQEKLFFKLEAEGFELEILQGMELTRPSKIAVDITPERNGLSCEREVALELQSKGYRVVSVSNRVLFATYSSEKKN